VTTTHLIAFLHSANFWKIPEDTVTPQMWHKMRIYDIVFQRLRFTLRHRLALVKVSIIALCGILVAA